MSSVEQKIREVLEQFNYDVVMNRTNYDSGEPDNYSSIADQATQAILQIIESDVIGESEWEDPDIRGSDQSGGDQVEAPWRRNALRESQRANLREDK